MLLFYYYMVVLLLRLDDKVILSYKSLLFSIFIISVNFFLNLYTSIIILHIHSIYQSVSLFWLLLAEVYILLNINIHRFIVTWFGSFSNYMNNGDYYQCFIHCISAFLQQNCSLACCNSAKIFLIFVFVCRYGMSMMSSSLS